ncbi:MAG TPA: iron ABC transporter permease [Pyrodictiaceae archaeon]|nr:iron ABC transporter permease [Pyrodictiaceae archaeon]
MDASFQIAKSLLAGPRKRGVLVILVVSTLLVLAGLMFHATTLSPSFLPLRAYRIIASACAGAALALAGLILQAVTQNVLAEPSLLGLSAGAYMLTGLAYLLGYPLIYYRYGLTLIASSGALLGLSLTLTVYRLVGGYGSLELILSGIAVSSALLGLGELIAYIVYTLWGVPLIAMSVGTLAYMLPSDALILSTVAVVGLSYTLVSVKSLNALQFGDVHAQSLGYTPRRIRIVSSLVASILTGAVVATCGPIPFIGLIAPNIARSVIGSENRLLAVTSAYFGASILLFSDSLLKLVGTMYGLGELPVGLLTGVIGGAFLAISLKSVRRAG